VSDGAPPLGEPPTDPTPPLDDLEAIEALAVELARAAGERAAEALGSDFDVEYKGEGEEEERKRRRRGRDGGFHDPVSEIDRAVEALIRERVGERFPSHALIGEEVDIQPEADAEVAWVIDPIDGTTNFVNGFPLFAVSIGVLHQGVPVVGAVWVGASHRLTPGVYHAREGGGLHLDGMPVDRDATAASVRRRLAAAPGGASGGTREWDHRVTGCIAIEAAYVAAGIFTSATFGGPRIWDIAGGTALVRAAGLEVWTRDGRGRWLPFDRFEVPERPIRRKEDPERDATLRDWRRPLVVGTSDATRAIRERRRAPGLLGRWWRRVRRWGR
jgi:myo-inositol-1(or 4)-monophosphatase